MIKETGLALGALIVFGTPCASRAADAASSPWSLHFQSTAVSQTHPEFRSPYSGSNSLSGGRESNTSFTATLFAGRALWKGGEAYVDPEVTAGSGFSGTHGVAAFPNGEIYRVSTPKPKINLARAYVRQFFGLGGEDETLEDGLN